RISCSKPSDFGFRKKPLTPIVLCTPSFASAEKRPKVPVGTSDHSGRLGNSNHLFLRYVHSLSLFANPLRLGVRCKFRRQSGPSRSLPTPDSEGKPVNSAVPPFRLLSRTYLPVAANACPTSENG